MSNQLKVSEETQIELPPQREIIGVDRTAWNRLKRLIKQLDNRSDYWKDAFWFFLAATLSFYLAAESSVGFSIRTPNLFSQYTLMCGVAAIMTGLGWYSSKSQNKTTKEEIQIQIQEIEIRKVVPSLEILTATYGAMGHYIDVLNNLKSVVQDNQLRIRASNDLDGDPIPGTKKSLYIKYRYGESVSEKTVEEGEVVEIP